MINHLAKNARTKLVKSTQNTKQENINNNKKGSQEFQEFQILNERIEILLQQFANLKDNIKIIAQAINKENQDNTMKIETDNENSNSL